MIPGPPPTLSKQRLATEAARALREAAELDRTDFADFCVDTGGRSVTDLARLIRAQAGGWPRLQT